MFKRRNKFIAELNDDISHLQAQVSALSTNVSEMSQKVDVFDKILQIIEYNNNWDVYEKSKSLKFTEKGLVSDQFAGYLAMSLDDRVVMTWQQLNNVIAMFNLANIANAAAEYFKNKAGVDENDV